VTIAYNITAEGTFSLAAIRLYKIGVALSELHILLPHFAPYVTVVGKHMGQNVLEIYLVHSFLLFFYI
jgi:hypothetical protein